MPDEQHGTTMYCPLCGECVKCDADYPGIQRRKDGQYQKFSEIPYYERERKCQSCAQTFKTAEVHLPFFLHCLQSHELIAACAEAFQTAHDSNGFATMVLTEAMQRVTRDYASAKKQ